MRIILDITNDKVDAMTKMVRDGRFPNNQEFFDEAISLIKWAIDSTLEGRAVAAIDETNKVWSELQLPFIERISAARKPTLN